MGKDIEDFVHPERISSQLICPICTQVLDKPVQTKTEHLFCEDELLEWLTRSSLCPVTKLPIDAQDIRRPGRLVLNMLGELQVFCANRRGGCRWTGAQDLLATHVAACQFRPAEELREQLRQSEGRVAELEERLGLLAEENARLEDLLMRLHEDYEQTKEALGEVSKRLRVYEALVRPSSSSHALPAASAVEPSALSDAERFKRLNKLSTLYSSPHSDKARRK